MALDVALPALPRSRVLRRGLTARVGLTLVVAGSFLVRAVASAAHPVPRYFPDEYIYTAIARALGSGHAPSVRGVPAHFPALLEPLLAAPLQALFSPATAYRLTQLENGLAMSLAAVPVYLLARRLSLAPRYALACAIFAIAIPDLVYASYTLSDPIGYPLALGALYLGVVAIDHPTRRSQLGFIALAALAMFARVQYVVLPVAFVLAAVLVDRRRVLRTQRLPLVLFVLPLVAALAAGPSRVLGYYSHVESLHIGTQLLHWGAVDLFLLAFASGVVLVPGALVALARPRGRTETAFSGLVAVFTAGLLLEAALYASNGSSRFQERYLFAALPLVPLAFGLYLKHGRPGRLAVALISLGFFGLAIRVPLSGYAAALGKTDSPFLFAVFRLEKALGTANGALVVSLLAVAAASLAVLVSRRGGGNFAVLACIALMAVASVGAVVNDAANAREIRHEYLPKNPSWVDAQGLTDVTLVQTVGSPPDRAIEQLYWNKSVQHEVRLGNALPTDVYAAPRVQVGRDGTLEGVGENVLFQDFAATVLFQNADLRATAGSFSLWAATGTPKLGLLEQGRYSNGWLSRSGKLTIWPDATAYTRGTLRFALTLPPGGKAVQVKFGKVRYNIAPGEVVRVAYTIDAKGPWSIAFSAPHGGRWLQDLRAVSTLQTTPQFFRAGSPASQPVTTA